MRIVLDLSAALARAFWTMILRLAWIVSHYTVIILCVLITGVTTVSFTAAFHGFSALASAISMPLQVPRANENLRTRLEATQAELDGSRRALAEERRRAGNLERARYRATERADRMNTRATELDADLRNSHVRISNLTSELADADARIVSLEAERRVTYRGETRTVREAVSNTVDRASRRTTIAAQRNIAAMVGEGIPFWGVAVIAAATAWEISDACAMMKDFYELEVAFAPEAAIPVDEIEVCGLQVPSSEEIWDAILSSPAAAAAKVTELYGSLPEFNVYSNTVGRAMQLWTNMTSTQSE